MTSVSPTRWPEEFRPDRVPVHSFNAIDVAAPPERVWAWLVRAPAWPTYYPNASNVRFENGAGPDLALGTTFTWRTFNVTVRTTVVEFEPGRRFLRAGLHKWHQRWLEGLARVAAGGMPG